jgi:hypothetical protein
MFMSRLISAVASLMLLVGTIGQSGAAQIRVGVFNMNNPALRELYNSDAERVEVMKRWGRELFSLADVVIVSELGTRRNEKGESIPRDEQFLRSMALESGLIHYIAAWGFSMLG